MGSGWNSETDMLELYPDHEKFLKQIADPADFRVSKLSYGYKFSLTSRGFGGYAVRTVKKTDAAYHSLRADAVGYIKVLIDDMHDELGLGKPASPSPPTRLVPNISKTGPFWVDNELVKKESAEKIQPKPKNKLECPDHHNLLVPAEEGVLKCPIPGCKKRMRRKSKESQDESPQVDKLTAANLLLEELRNAPREDPYLGSDSYGRLPVNDRPVRVRYKNNRWYLLQQTDGGEVAIDVTNAYKKYESFHGGGSKDNSYRLHLEW